MTCVKMSTFVAGKTPLYRGIVTRLREQHETSWYYTLIL